MAQRVNYPNQKEKVKMNLVKLDGNDLSVWGTCSETNTLLHSEEFPALCLWSDDAGNVAVVTLKKRIAIVQSIDLEWVDQDETNSWMTDSFAGPILQDIHDTFILTHYNRVCLQCWITNAETITNEGDAVGQTYSIRIVEPDQCKTIFHDGD